MKQALYLSFWTSTACSSRVAGNQDNQLIQIAAKGSAWNKQNEKHAPSQT